MDVPPLCTHTYNPLTGSTLTITYTPQNNLVLEVYSLTDYVHGFHGSAIVRDIEQFAQVVAANCVQLLGVEVSVSAEFVLNIGQRVRAVVVGVP